jgi:hypothetical protein
VYLKLLILLGLLLCLQHDCRQTGTAAGNTPLPAATPVKEMKTVIEKDDLAKRLELIEPSVAAIVRDTSSTLDEMTAQFLTTGHIYRVEKFAPTRMIIHYIGVDEKGYTALLTGDPQKFVEFAEVVQVRLDRNETRVEFGKAYLDIGLAGSERLQVLNSISEIKARPNLKEAELAKFAEFNNKFEKVIRPASCLDNKCSYYAIYGQDLVLFELEISTTGQVEKKMAVLESNLLIPYSM